MKFNPESIQWMVTKMVSSASASWVNPNGNRNFPYVNDNGEAWDPNFNWTDNDFNDNWRWLVEVSDMCSFPAIMRGFFCLKHVFAIHRAFFQSRQYALITIHTSCCQKPYSPTPPEEKISAYPTSPPPFEDEGVFALVERNLREKESPKSQ